MFPEHDKNHTDSEGNKSMTRHFSLLFSCIRKVPTGPADICGALDSGPMPAQRSNIGDNDVQLLKFNSR